MRRARRNSDERSRDLERRARQGDPQAEAALAASRSRSGLGVGAWYSEHLATLGVPEGDFRELLRLLVRGFYWENNRVLGPRDWAWLVCADSRSAQTDWTAST